MIKIDLITGFLGSGKTTLLRRYARFLIDSGLRVGILENDYGAVNVDVMLLSELEGERCVIEAVAGACCADCHRRRFKTKLIALAMSGCDRVLVEPSGIFDVDEFFDSLREPPLDEWYEVGSVIAVADAEPGEELSPASRYLLASQAADAGLLILSKTENVSGNAADEAVGRVNSALRELGCERQFGGDDVIKKPWSELGAKDFERLRDCGRRFEGFVKLLPQEQGFSTIYFMNTGLSLEELRLRTEALFGDPSCGRIFRVKGFTRGADGWYELNAAKNSLSLLPIERGQDVLIAIGEGLCEDRIREILLK